jgi:hypothetical protein
MALGIISNVNLSSVDADLVTKKNESYYRARYPNIFKGLGKTNWTYTIALYPDAKPFASSLENTTAFASLAKDSSTEGSGKFSRLTDMFSFVKSMQILTWKTNWTHTIALYPDAKPFALSVPWRVPLPLMDKVKAELTRMEKLGVISRIDEPTEWCAGMVVVSSKRTRFCG